MKVLHQYDMGISLQRGNQWSFLFYAAAPFLWQGCIYYPHGRGIISCIKIDPQGETKETNFCVPPGMKIDWPKQWRMFVHQGHVILSCGESGQDVFLDLDDDMKQILFSAQEQLAIPERTNVKEVEEVKLSNHTMRYKNSRSYQCQDMNGKLLWTEKHKGYRYTPFEERDDCVIFGTAQFGGGLYCYRLADGECLCAIDTKGTPNYCWNGDLIICHSREGSLLWIDPFAGEIVRDLKLDCLFMDESGYFADERYVCAVGFQKKTNSPCICLIDIQEE